MRSALERKESVVFADSLSLGDKGKGKQMKESKMNAYKEIIIEMIGKIEDENFLRRIYVSLRDYLKEKAE